MKVNKVNYKVRSDFSQQNRTNIQTVMEELKDLKRSDIFYTSIVADDKQNFEHIFMYENEESKEIFTSLQSFQHFRAELMKNLAEPVESQPMSLVGSSYL